MLLEISPGSYPMPEVALACGSASTNKVLCSKAAKLAARLMAEVVLPTPPFWFATAIIFPILILLLRLNLYCNCLAYFHKDQVFTRLFCGICYRFLFNFNGRESIKMHGYNVFGFHPFCCDQSIFRTHCKVIADRQQSIIYFKLFADNFH